MDIVMNTVIERERDACTHVDVIIYLCKILRETVRGKFEKHLFQHLWFSGEMGGLDATTTICHRYTPPEQLQFFVASADILVTAAGLPGLITGDMIKPGCAIIDVGINRITDPSTGKPKLVGDCDFESE